MITPIEIQNKVFKSGGLGYDKKDVDSFMNEILDNYEELYRDRMDMQDKINALNKSIQYYKSIEKTLQKALVLAEKTAEETRESARKNAQLIEQDAVSKATILLEDAKRELEAVRKQTLEIVRQYDMYKARFKSLMASQNELLDSQSFAISLEGLSMFDPVPEVEIPARVYEEQANKAAITNPLEDADEDFPILNLDEE